MRCRLFAAPLVVFVVVLLTGCGSESSSPSSSSARSASSDASGVWEIDRNSTLAALKKSSPDLSDLETKIRTGVLESGGMDWKISLHRDGTAVVVMADPAGKTAAIGTWEAKGGSVGIKYPIRQGRAVASLTGAVQGQHLHLREEPVGDKQPAVLLAKNAALAIPEPPAPGPLRKQCPPTAAGSGAGTADIVGLRVGMSYDEVKVILECLEDVRVIQTTPLWVGKSNYGIPTIGALRGTGGIPCMEHEAPACDTAGGRFPPVRNATTEYFVAFTGLPGEEVARVIWRRTLFDESAAQTIATLTAALNEKYGQPQLQAVGNHSRLNRPRPGATNMVWARDPKGQPMVEPRHQFSSAAMRFEQCLNGPNPVFAARQSWNSGCGMTTRAEIVPHQNNLLLARELNMVLVHQADLFHGNRQFQNALKLRGEEEAQKKQSASPPPRL